MLKKIFAGLISAALAYSPWVSTYADTTSSTCQFSFGYSSADVSATPDWSDFGKFFEEKVPGCVITAKEYASQQDLINAVKQHKVDLAYLKPFPYYLATKNNLKSPKPIAVAFTAN